MFAAILYIFCFSTWALGLLSWIAYMGKKFEDWDLVHKEKKLELQVAQFQLEKVGLYISTQNSSKSAVENKAQTEKPNKQDIPEKIKELMVILI